MRSTHTPLRAHLLVPLEAMNNVLVFFFAVSGRGEAAFGYLVGGSRRGGCKFHHLITNDYR